ncbi:type IX secretion system PorP/SprF family membrane protein [Marinoscillum furvescens DSM 4134]|uniref:Type IX secretion system PorP/SprF family membrane protein n=2 Tax=Marinoscillum furvescens TaxID=1026 RepID=A0A3D9L5I6_MARFU|nr:type IX secretion system PorP/SprF family membrane protein [Marinoscillum furvescens DSM 4134]
MTLFLLGWELTAQQTPLYTHAYLNRYLYNPAMAGYEQSSAYFLYRKQWAGVDGAPETQVFTLDGQLKNHPVGLGVTFINDVTNVLGRTGGALTGAYEVGLTPNQSLRFGMSFTALRNRVFFDRIRAEDVSDPGLLEKVDQHTVFEGNIGFSYQVKNLRIGFSGEQMFQNTFKHEEEAIFRSLDYTLVRHFYTTAEYTFTIGNDYKVRPHVLVRTVQGLRSQYDANLYASYKDFIWTNLVYRHDIGAGASIGFELEDQYVFGYAYEFPTTDLSIIGGSTHEFTVGIRLHRAIKAPATRQAKARPSHQSLADQERLDAIAQQNERVRGKLEKAESKLQSQNEELQRLKEIVEAYQQDLEKTVQKLQASAVDSADHSMSYYVVVGALKKFENAKAFQRLLLREAQLSTKLVQSASGTWFFIYADETKSFTEAQQLLEKVQGSDAMPFIIEEPWIYKSEK